jgi:hypothetical protein
MAHAGDLVGTPLVDHVVVARGASTSMLEQHLVPSFDRGSSVKPRGVSPSGLRGAR